VRIKGAIGVVELDRIGDMNELKRRFIEAGVFVRPFGKIVYLTPAFTISKEEHGSLTRAVISVLEQWTKP
jgi:adenosylmethionine-8-amino-7-oxononanoate aminotransferase